MKQYKEILGFETLYKVSNEGDVFSLISNKILKPSLDNSGYQIVTLCKNKKHYTKTIHRLVALAWFGESKLDVNHINGIKTDNNIYNLEFVTKSQNIKHALDIGLFKPNYEKIAILKRKKVLQINPITNEVVNVFESAHEASRLTKINRGNICTCCRTQKGLVEGFKWMYQDN